MGVADLFATIKYKLPYENSNGAWVVDETSIDYPDNVKLSWVRRCVDDSVSLIYDHKRKVKAFIAAAKEARSDSDLLAAWDGMGDLTFTRTQWLILKALFDVNSICLIRTTKQAGSTFISLRALTKYTWALELVKQCAMGWEQRARNSRGALAVPRATFTAKMKQYVDWLQEELVAYESARPIES
jgi:hypothetical protein